MMHDETIEIPLTQGHSAVITASDFELVSAFKWHLHPGRHTNYARTSIKKGGIVMHILMHVLILGKQSGSVIDHIDENGLNNTRGNIRHVSPGMNRARAAHQKNNTTGSRGVYWHKAMGKWKAQIGHNGRRIHIGYFSSKRNATTAYSQKYREFFGSERQPTRDGGVACGITS